MYGNPHAVLRSIQPCGNRYYYRKVKIWRQFGCQLVLELGARSCSLVRSPARNLLIRLDRAVCGSSVSLQSSD